MSTSPSRTLARSSPPTFARTHFEDLSNEVIYEIFDCLEVYHTHEAFHDLNQRFHNLLTCSSLPLHIDMSFLNNSNFERYLTKFVLPNIDRIRSLHLRNSLMSDHVFSSPENIRQFTGLKTIILDQPISFNGLIRLNCLPNLSSLIINQSDGMTMEDYDWHWISSFPALKYFKLSYEGDKLFLPSSETFDESSSMEHLVINSAYNFQKLPYLLSRFPNLRRLSMNYLFHPSARRIQEFSKLASQLTHVSLNLRKITFDQLEPFLVDFSPNLQVLRISANDDVEYINATRWERLISTAMLNLRVFDMQYTCQIRTNHYQLVFDDLCKRFISPFCIQRQWHSANQGPGGNYVLGTTILHSVKPYRRRCYVLQGKHDSNRYPFSDYRSVHHVRTSNQSAIIDCPIFFPNADELTIAGTNQISPNSLITTLDRIVPMKHLHKITINLKDFPLHILIRLLYHTPNCYQLSLESLSVSNVDLRMIQHDQRFLSTSDVSKTTDLVIKSTCTLKLVKLLTALCPQLQHLTINVAEEEFTSVIQYLLSKSNKYTCHLTSLHIQSTADIYTEKLLNLLLPLKPSGKFEIQEMNFTTCYIWW